MNRRGFFRRMTGALAAVALTTHSILGELIPVPEEPKIGIAYRFVRAYDVNSQSMASRFDVLYGWSHLYPDFAVKIQD